MRSVDDLEPAFAKAQAWQAEAITILTDGGLVINSNATTIAQLAMRSRLPSMASFPVSAEAGQAALAYGVDVAAQCERAAYFVDRILHGRTRRTSPSKSQRCSRLR